MRNAFSLVELSIVLVILGLLTGGILAGQNLIRAAEIRSITNQFQSIQSAHYTFRDKYFALAGDFKDATKFWGLTAGTAAPLDATCFNTPSTDATTCNGDGDGQIGAGGGAYVTEDNEIYRYWQHLANAGLIEGSYTGRSTSGSNTSSVPGTNVPRGKISGSGFRMGYRDNPNGISNQFPIVGHLIRFGDFQANTVHGSNALVAEEAWNIDTKMDDGLPGLGSVHSRGDSSVDPNCVTTTDPATAEYTLTATSKACALDFNIDTSG